MSENGVVTRVAGTVVFASGFSNQSKNIMVRIGEDRILGEVVQIREETLVIQAYEETKGVRIGDIVENTESPFMAVLGPGMLGTTFDGLQRPTDTLLLEQGPFLERGTLVQPFDMGKKWHFRPTSNQGDRVEAGSILGYYREHNNEYPLIVPHGVSRTRIASILTEGNYAGRSIIATLENGAEVGFYRRWQIRQKMPHLSRIEATEHLITGQRIIDSLFPVTKGGTAIVSGGFGTGKTILEQALAKFARVDIIILVLIGERGNEVATVLGEFAELKDDAGNYLLDRTVVIANTSNMPVAAREASIYLGMTLGEYYRDLGMNVAILADSMSRWAEAVREISGRLEEMPAEEGYPAYMSKSLGEFFERAGKFRVASGGSGSITFIAAISPPGGDFTEPVTQAALQVTGSFWALSTELARSRHFPSINWNESFSQFGDYIATSHSKNFPHWGGIRKSILSLLKREEDLQQSVRLLGRDNLSETQKGMLDMTRFIKDAFLQQDAFDKIDQNCSLEKQYLMMQLLELIQKWLFISINRGMTSSEFFTKQEVRHLKRMHEVPENELEKLQQLADKLELEVVK